MTYRRCSKNPTAKLLLCAVFASAACASDTNDLSEDAVQATGDYQYATSTVVLGDDAQTTYIALLDNLDSQKIDLKKAREFPGWTGIDLNAGKVYVADGERPTFRQYDVTKNGDWKGTGEINFADYGAEYASVAFVSADKAYSFPDNIVTWDPKEMSITGEVDRPQVDDLPDGLEWSRVTSGRQNVTRGNRMFIATNWANWDDYTMAEDSLIIVIDTDKDEIIGMLKAECPYIDVASLADDGTVYFSNWVYSAGQTLLHDKRKACAVRIEPDEDTLDKDWKVTFADVTGGHEAAALRYLGDNKAVISVYQEDRLDFDDPETETSSVGGAENWQAWIFDLETMEAKPIEGVGFNSGGFGLERVDGRGFVMTPKDDYATTTVYEVTTEGKAKEAWTVNGWSGQLVRFR